MAVGSPSSRHTARPESLRAESGRDSRPVDRHAAQAETISRPALVRFSKFVGWGLVLGWIGCTGLPLLFHASLSPDPALFGPAVFVFIFVMWINIHHYFIDNVIWRRDNDDVRKYLFAPR